MTDEMLSMIKSGTDVTITPSEGAKIVRGADGKITSIVSSLLAMKRIQTSIQLSIIQKQSRHGKIRL